MKLSDLPLYRLNSNVLPVFLSQSWGSTTGKRQWLYHLKIRQKISLSIAVALGVVAVGMTSGILVGNHLRQQAKLQLDTKLEHGSLLIQFQTNLLEVESHRKGLLSFLEKPDELRYVLSEYKEDAAEIYPLWSKLKVIYEGQKIEESGGEGEDFSTLVRKYDRWIQEYTQLPNELSQKIDLSSLQSADLTTTRKVLEEFTYSSSVSKNIFDFVEELENFIEKDAEELKKVQTTLAKAEQLQIQILVGSLLLSTIVAALLAGYISRTISKPLQKATQIAERVSQEDNFSLRVPVINADEVGVLATTLNQLIERVQKLLQERQAAEAHLVQSEKMSSLGQLVAGVAHEINNPVNFIYGNLDHVNEYTQNLLELVQLYQKHYPKPGEEIEDAIADIELEFITEDLAKILQSMQVGTKRIREIVLSLRNFSRLDEAEFKTVDIHEGIDSTLLILRHRFKAKSDAPEIQIIKDYAQLPLVECYPGQLNQVFMNLLANAIDAVEELRQSRSSEAIDANPTTIRISTEAIDNSWVAIHIADNGLGMSQVVRSRLFDPFFTTKPIGKGTGLGLSISYQIVTEKHGGKLYCSSALGKGTEFLIQIPIRQHK
jgi:two-component system, NtrC family, sensor kinase